MESKVGLVPTRRYGIVDSTYQAHSGMVVAIGIVGRVRSCRLQDEERIPHIQWCHCHSGPTFAEGRGRLYPACRPEYVTRALTGESSGAILRR